MEIKQTKIGFMFMFLLAVALFISAEVSAIELNPFANSKTFVPELKADMSDFLKEDFNSKYGAIQLSKTRFWIETDRIAEYSLTENTDQCLINCKSKGKAVLYTDGKLFDDKYFLNKKGIEVEIDSQYYIKEIETYYEDVPQYKEVCSLQEIISNSTIKDTNLLEKPINQEVCNQELIGYEKVEKTKEVWNEYNFEVLKAGEYEWEIRGSKATSQSVDFIPTAHGKSLNEWSWWNSDWEFKKEILIQENSANTLNNYSVELFIEYNSNMNSNFSDLRFINDVEDTELGYWIENKNDGVNATIWVKVPELTASQNTSIYMYYGNALAESNSNKQKAWIIADDFDGSTINSSIWTQNSNGFSVSGGNLVWANSEGVTKKINTIINFKYFYMDFELHPSTNNNKGIVSVFPKFNASSENSNVMYADESNTGGTNGEVVLHQWGWNPQVPYGSYTNMNNVAQNYSISYNSSHYCFFKNKVLYGCVPESYTIQNVADKEYPIGMHIWYSKQNWYSNFVHIRNFIEPSPTYTIGAEEMNEGVSVTLNSPADNLQSTSSTINFNATITPKEATIKNVTLYLNDEEYLNLYNTNEKINYSKILTLDDGSYTWNITACWIRVSTEENCTESTIRTFSIDATLPNITILSGNGTQPYYYSGINHTVNFTIEDDKLDSGWWGYGGEEMEILDTNLSADLFDGDFSTVFLPDYHKEYYILLNVKGENLNISLSESVEDGGYSYFSSSLIPTSSCLTNIIKINTSGYIGPHGSSHVHSFYCGNISLGQVDAYTGRIGDTLMSEIQAEGITYNLSGNLLIKDYINASEISSFTTTSFVKIDEIKVGTLLNYTSGEIKSSSGSYQKELLQSIVYMNGTVVNQTNYTNLPTYVLDVFMNPNPTEMVDRVEYWAREVSKSGAGYVQNRKVSPLKEEVRQFSVTFPVTKDIYDFSIYANDTFGNIASKEVEWDYLFFEENRSYPNEIIDTKQETIYIDITSLYDLTVNLNYSGTIYPTLEQIISSNKIRYYTILNIPNVAVNTNKTIFWNIYSNQGNATTTESSILVKSLNYSFNQPRQLLNITIYDEITGDKLNNTQVEALVTYYLQNPIANKTLYEVHTNNNHTLGTNLEIDSLYTKNKFTYQLAGYQPREYLENLILVDGSITQLTLYLLSNSDGTTQLFSITEATTMEQLADVKIIAYEQVGTEYQYRDATYSDDSGSANLWLNPDKAHRITASKEGCTSKTVSMYPTGVSIQNIELDCGGVIPGPSYNGSEYYTEYNITVSFNPTIKEISYDADNPSTHNKTFSVKYEDQSCNVTGAEFKLIDGDTGLVLNTITSLDCEDTLSLIQNVSGKTGITAYLLLTKSTGETLTYRIIYRITDISDLAYDGSSISRILQKLTDMDGFGLDQKTKTFIAFIVLFLILGGLSMGGVIKSEGFSMYILILAYIAGLSYLGWFGLELPTTFSNATIQATVNKYMILFLSSLIIGGIALSKAND